MTLVLPAFAARQEGDRDSARWGAAILIALGLHAAAAIGLWRWREPVAPIVAAPPATFIDLAPLPSPAPPPEVQQPPAAPAEPSPPEAIDLPKPVEPPLPVEPPKAVALPKPVPPKPQHPVQRHQAPPRELPQPVQENATPAQTPAPATAAPVAAAPVPSAAASSVPPSFSALIAARLERYKRYPTLAQRRGEEGTVLLRFVLNRAGDVVAAAIERGSGHALLDDEVLALLQRATPLPPLPAEITGDTLTLVVPVNFSLR